MKEIREGKIYVNGELLGEVDRLQVGDTEEVLSVGFTYGATTTMAIKPARKPSTTATRRMDRWLDAKARAEGPPAEQVQSGSTALTMLTYGLWLALFQGIPPWPISAGSMPQPQEEEESCGS